MEENTLNTRNAGIDILRLMLMLLIIILHLVVQGGVLRSGCNSWTYFIGVVLETMTLPAVNVFALITGYMSYRSNERSVSIKKYFVLWLQVVWYCVLGIIIGKTVFHVDISSVEVIKYLLPVTFSKYWYFTAYTGVYLFMPFLNDYVSKMDEKMFKKFLSILLMIFCPYTMMVNIVGDPFDLNAGYSFLWLSIMWIVGAGLRKFQILNCVSRKTWILLSVFLIGAGAMSDMLIRCITLIILGKSIASNIFLSYLSPIIIMLSIVYLRAFEKIKIARSKEKGGKIIAFLAKGAFGIYLFHVHPIMMDHLIHDRYLYLALEIGAKVFLIIFRDAIIVFLIALLTDLLRTFLFRAMHIDKIANLLQRLIAGTRVRVVALLSEVQAVK